MNTEYTFDSLPAPVYEGTTAHADGLRYKVKDGAWVKVPVPSEADSCLVCRFWSMVNQRPSEWTDGGCLRHAPGPDMQIRLSDYGRGTARWPQTKATQWCGDFEKAPPVEDDNASR